MAKLDYLVIHCTATPKGRKVSKEDIERWHIKERGWSRVGYSDMIHLDGSLENLVPFDQDDNVDNWEITNGAKGFNTKSRHVVYVGGVSDKIPNGLRNHTPEDTRTADQSLSLITYIKYMILRYPNIKVVGHNQISNKACPSFDVPNWLKIKGIDGKNIM